MIRLPLLPTIVVAIAVAAMFGLGIWQLGRAEEKAQLLAALERSRDLPPADLAAPRGPLSYRRALARCRVEGARPDVRAGQNEAGISGYSYRIPCRSEAEGIEGRLLVDIGWARRPDALSQASLDGPVTGRLGMVGEEGPVVLTAAEPVPPLEASGPPSPERIPDNHVFYAFQWFFFALAAATIYLLALRRRGRRGDSGRPNP